MTSPWSEIRKRYEPHARRGVPPANVRALQVMHDLVEAIGNSPLAGTLLGWSEHFDLCIVHASDPGPRFRCYPHCGARIRISPRREGKLVFEYLPDLREHLEPVFGGKAPRRTTTDELRATITRLMDEGRIEDEAAVSDGFAKLQQFLDRFGWLPKGASFWIGRRA